MPPRAAIEPAPPPRKRRACRAALALGAWSLCAIVAPGASRAAPVSARADEPAPTLVRAQVAQPAPNGAAAPVRLPAPASTPAPSPSPAPASSAAPSVSPRPAAVAERSDEPNAQRATSSYERWVPPAALDHYERELLGTVRASAHARQVTLHYDWRLGRAALALLPWARAHAGEAFPMAELRRAAWSEGTTDGQLAALAVTTHRSSLQKALRRQLTAMLPRDVDLDHLGLAAEVEELPEDHELDRHTVVVVLSRRSIRLAPVPAQVPSGSQLVLTGRMATNDAHDLALSLTCPDGRTRRQLLETSNGRFHSAIAVGNAPGTLQVQLSIDRGHGPEIAADFPVAVTPSHAPAPAPAPTPAAAPTQPSTPSGLEGGSDTVDASRAMRTSDAALQTYLPPPAAHGSLLSLLYGLRGAHGLELPVPTPSLMQVARQHATDMVAHHFFAHVSRRTGNVTHRLAAAKQPFLHVVENLAEGRDVDAIFQQWLQSPSHLLNLLDNKVEGVGLAVARRPNGAQVAVLVMAAFFPEP